jgi:hypothetical protein
LDRVSGNFSILKRGIDSSDLVPNPVIQIARDEKLNRDRYQGQNGEVHWNGEVQASKVPKAIRKQLNAK